MTTTSVEQSETGEVERLAKLERDRYRDAMGEENTFTSLSRLRVLELDAFYGGPGYHKMIYGDRLVADLANIGLNFAERTYHEATLGPIADSAAVFGKIILETLDIENKYFPDTLELNTGSGSQTYSLVRKGFNVLLTVEKSSRIHYWAQRNLQTLGVNGRVERWGTGDAWDQIQEQAAGGFFYDIVYIDPPWDGIHFKESEAGEGPIDFSYMKNRPEAIIPHIMQVTDVVAMKARGSVLQKNIELLAESAGCGTHVLNHHFKMGDRRLHEKFIYFVKGNYAYGHEVDDVNIVVDPVYLDG